QGVEKGAHPPEKINFPLREAFASPFLFVRSPPREPSAGFVTNKGAYLSARAFVCYKILCLCIRPGIPGGLPGLFWRLWLFGSGLPNGIQHCAVGNACKLFGGVFRRRRAAL